MRQPDANDPRVASGTIGKARREFREELLRGAGRGEESRSLTARVKRIALAERDHALGQRTRSLGAQDGGLDAFLLDEVRDQVAQHGPAMRRLLSEFVS